GVKIYVKESAKSVVSQRSGIYDLNLDGSDSTVVFSKIGYLIKELSIDNRKIINVTLENENSLFNETVDLGYYSVKRRDVNIVATYLNTNEFSDAPVARFEEALAGREAGLQVSSSQGQQGDPLNLVVRGEGSVYNSSPLYIVDGVVIEDFNSLVLN